MYVAFIYLYLNFVLLYFYFVILIPLFLLYQGRHVGLEQGCYCHSWPRDRSYLSNDNEALHQAQGVIPG